MAEICTPIYTSSLSIGRGENGGSGLNFRTFPQYPQVYQQEISAGKKMKISILVDIIIYDTLRQNATFSKSVFFTRGVQGGRKIRA